MSHDLVQRSGAFGRRTRIWDPTVMGATNPVPQARGGDLPASPSNGAKWLQCSQSLEQRRCWQWSALGSGLNCWLTAPRCSA